MRISQIETSSGLKFSKSVHAFTEQGVAMLSGLLNSPRAIAVNVEIMRAFVRLRRFLPHIKTWPGNWTVWRQSWRSMMCKSSASSKPFANSCNPRKPAGDPLALPQT